MKALTALTNRLGNRNSNQDRCLILERPGGVLLCVADGMGGHARGDLAAQATVDSLGRNFLGQREPVIDPQGFLTSALQSAHLEVVEAGRNEQPPIVPRTTCVVCLVQEDHAFWAHVGDSRLYLLRSGKLLIRTRDHTPVEELLQSGAIGPDDARSHPLRNSVSRCLGGALTLPKISFDQAELKPDDTLLLCTDGLWSAVPEERLAGLPAYGDLDRSINQLADEAENASYPHADNITLVGLRWLAAGSPKQASADGNAQRQPESVPAEEKDPLQQAIDETHRAMLEYAAEMKK